jgi:hypothetical protein
MTTPRYNPRRTQRRVGERIWPITQSDLWKYFAIRILSAVHNKVFIYLLTTA